MQIAVIYNATTKQVYGLAENHQQINDIRTACGNPNAIVLWVYTGSEIHL